MLWTEESKREFDRLMAEEVKWMHNQWDAERHRDYSEAEFCNKMRWRCMDAALAALKPMTEGASC